MQMMTVQLRGAEALQRKLQELPKRVRSKVTRKAVMAGSTVVLQAARSSVPTRTRQLKKSLGRKGKTTRQGYYVKIGSRRGFSIPLGSKTYNPSRIAHLAEHGARPHVIRSRRHPGARPQPWLNPALERNLGQVKSTMASKMATEIAQEARSA
jgi:HK97 gp10 family phage protein